MSAGFFFATPAPERKTYLTGGLHIDEIKFGLGVGLVVKQERPAVNFRLVLTAVFAGLKYVFVFLLLVTLLLALTYWLGWDWSAYEQTIYQYTIYTAVVLGALATGYKARAKGWLMGIVLAVAAWLIFFILGRICGLEQKINAGLINGAIAVLLGIVGGVIGINL